MSLTKENLIDAHEQGLSINTRNGNIKIVTILGDVYGVNHCDTNSKLVKWWMFENFERNEAKIEQPKTKIDLSILKEGEIYFAKILSGNILFKYLNTSIDWVDCILSEYQYFVNFNKTFNMSKVINKRLCEVDSIKELRLPTESELELFYSKFPELKPKPKYNGKAVKCDTVEQLRYIATKCNSIYLHAIEHNFKEGFNYYELINDTYRHNLECIEKHIEIISFSQYCEEQGIKEPIFIQGFEVKDGYNDVVMVSADKNTWHCHLLTSVNNKQYPFHSKSGGSWSYCRYPRRDEINEIKFS